MGGNALIIQGRVDLERATRPGIWGRLVGKKPWTAADLKGNFVTLPPAKVQFLAQEFREFLSARLRPAWPSTRVIQDYLKIGTKVFLRGDCRKGGDRTWYLQLSFSGCGGMAEISSLVATHWAEVWFRETEMALKPKLIAAGFTPLPLPEKPTETTRFLPFGEFGYVAQVPSRESIEGSEEEFEFDEAAMEALLGEVAPLVREIKTKGSLLLADTRCHCQMCDPKLFPWTPATRPMEG